MSKVTTPKVKPSRTKLEKDALSEYHAAEEVIDEVAPARHKRPTTKNAAKKKAQR